MNYNVNDWYWIVAGSTSQVFSSASISYVSNVDATYTAWVAEGNAATNILNATELLEVLTIQWLQNKLTSVVLNSTGTPSLNATYPLDPVSQSYVTSMSTGIASGKGLPGGGSTFNWNGVTFTSSEFLSVAYALENYLYNFVQALEAIVLTGTGSVPTTPLVIA